MRARVRDRGERAIATIGVFDGVHLGHRALLDTVQQAAREARGVAAAVTFRPPPDAILRPRAPVAEITPWAAKRTLLLRSGIARLLALRFSRALASLPPEAFVDQVLLREFDLAGLVIGYDFRFGAKGAGDAALLRRLGRRHGFRVHRVPAVLYEGRPISSTRIREAVRRGAVARAGAMLGRDFAVGGRVVSGRGLGKRLLVPTANLLPAPTQLLPGPGVYLTRVRRRGRAWAGVAQVGPSPTLVGGSQAPIEVHLLDFEGELRGCRLAVEFLEKRRETRRFPSLRQLREAVDRDIRWARKTFHGRVENGLAFGGGRVIASANRS